MSPSIINVRRGAAPLLLVALAGALCSGSVRADDAPPDATDAGRGVALEVAPPAAAPRRQRAVYVCLGGGVPIFADRPCGATSEARLLPIQVVQPGSPSTRRPPPTASTRPQSHRATPAEPADDTSANRCLALQRQLDEIDDRMRSGYTAREAARLWNRWRDVKERLREARC